MRLKTTYISIPGLLILFISLFCHSPLTAQETSHLFYEDKIEFEHIGEEQGVTKVLQCVFQDSKGFLWFGSAINGLYRYNGYEFKQYLHDFRDKSSLSDNNIDRVFLEDSSGDFWFNADGELSRYNRMSDNFSHFVQDPDNKFSIGPGMVESVIQDKDGLIWIRSAGDGPGLSVYDRSKSSFKHLYHNAEDPESINSNDIDVIFLDDSGFLWIAFAKLGVERFEPEEGNLTKVTSREFVRWQTDKPFLKNVCSIVEDENGNICFGTDKGLVKYSQSRNTCRHYLIHPDTSDRSNTVTKLSIDYIGRLWIGTGNGIALYDQKEDSIILHKSSKTDAASISPGRIESISHDHNGNTWIVTKNNTFSPSEGICRIDTDNKRITRFTSDAADPSGLSTDLVTSTLVDKSGILWLTTLDDGIIKYDPKKTRFGLYQYDKNSMNAMPEGNIFSIFEDKNHILWIGTHESGLFKLDRNTGEIARFMYDENKPTGINNNTVLCFCEGSDGILWFGGLGGLSRLDTKTNVFEAFTHNEDDPNTISSNHIMSIYKDDNGILWIGTINGGLNRFDPREGVFRNYIDRIEDSLNVPVRSVLHVTGNAKGVLWVSSFEGLFKMIPDKNGRPVELKHYKYSFENSAGLSSNNIRMVVEDKSGFLWIATEGGGLNRLNISDETIEIYTTEDGLASNIIEGLEFDDKGNLWIGSHNGLSKYIPSSDIFHNYSQSDGLQSNVFSMGSHFRSKKGEMFFGGETGINYFYPGLVSHNTKVPSIVIERLSLINKQDNSGKTFPELRMSGDSSRIVLKHNMNYLAFEFTALNYTNTERNHYKYRMIGLGEDTIYSGTRRYADFHDMKPGNYTFWVTGSNNDLVWNEEGVSLNFVIKPPWWRSKLAYAIYILLFALLITAYVRKRTKNLKKIQKELEKRVEERTREIKERDARIMEMDRMKTRFFANISHEFRTLVTLIINPLEAFASDTRFDKKDQGKLAMIRQNGQRLLNLVNQLLDLSKLDGGKLKLKLQNDNLTKSLNLTLSLFRSLAEKKGITYYYEIPEYDLIAYFDSDKLDTIINNLLSNAFKYTPSEGEVSCTVQYINSEAGQEEDLVTIAIWDNGPGVEEDKLSFIFDRFYQADDYNKVDSKGTGIGLSVAKEYIDLLHGDINVESKTGKGLSFKLIVPLGIKHLEESEYEIIAQLKDIKQKPAGDIISVESESAIPKQDHYHSGRGVSILIVEDHEGLRTFLREQLERDYTIFEANDGEEGLIKAIKLIPDIIISDVMMPGLDGIELCEKIKTNERTSHIPLILLTAKADIDDRLTGLESGADDYIIKPFNMDEVNVRIKNLVNQRKLLRKRYSGSLNNSSDELTFNSYDINFIDRVATIVENHITDFEFSVKDLQDKTGMSHTQLYRKLFALTDMSPSKFIRTTRLKHAIRLLEQGDDNVSSVAFRSGFNNLSYFTKCFKELTGVSPSKYRQQFTREE